MSLVTSSITNANRRGLSIDPWWTPTFTSNDSDLVYSTLTDVSIFAYISIIAFFSLSSTPFPLSDHQITSLGTRSKAFSKSKNSLLRSLSAIYFSNNCLIMKIASVVHLPGMKPTCISSSFTLRCIDWNHSHHFFVHHYIYRYDPWGHSSHFHHRFNKVMFHHQTNTTTSGLFSYPIQFVFKVTSSQFSYSLILISHLL